MRSYPSACWLLLTLAACASPAPPSLATHAARPGTTLFPAVVQGRWGFIDSTGGFVIAPRFEQVQRFTEGLAPAREGGRYGYINCMGQFVLPPRYAYAEPFQGRAAVVYSDSLLQLIDRAGHQLPLPATYRRLEWLAATNSRGLWVGSRAGWQSQLLTARGQLLDTTWFKEVGRLSDNRLVVSRAVASTDPNGPTTDEWTAVLDGRGKLVIPYRRFDQVSTFRGGLAVATRHQAVYDENTQQQCFIDTTGRVLATLPNGKYSVVGNEPADGMVQAYLITSRVDKLNPESYPVALNRRGQALFYRPELRFLGDYGHHRAWASTASGGWLLLDRAGRTLNKVAIESVLEPAGFDKAPTFDDGVVLVELAHQQGYAALDTTGRVVRQLPSQGTGYRRPDRQGNLLVLYGDSAGQMGCWNWRTGRVLASRFSALDPAGYQHGLLAVVENHRLGYLDVAGRYVWREPAPVSHPLNLDYRRGATYGVATPPLPRSTDTTSAALASLMLTAAPVTTANAFAPGISGRQVVVTNVSPHALPFSTQGGRLYMVVQAQDARGRWRDIEQTPDSFCGNSYYQVSLAAGQRWQFTIPAYAGAHPTRLRVVLRQRRPGRPGHATPAWTSNVFSGSINLTQFWRQEDYAPESIMAPYWN